MQDAIRKYWNVRTANALNLTVRQVEVTNNLEQQADEHAPYWALDQRPFSVELLNGNVHISMWSDEWHYEGVVRPDGTTVWQ